MTYNLYIKLILRLHKIENGRTSKINNTGQKRHLKNGA